MATETSATTASDSTAGAVTNHWVHVYPSLRYRGNEWAAYAYADTNACYFINTETARSAVSAQELDRWDRTLDRLARLRPPRGL